MIFLTFDEVQDLKDPDGNLNLTFTECYLPNGISVRNLNLAYAKIDKLPSGLIIYGDLDIRHSNIKYLPYDLVVKGDIIA